MWLGIGKSVHLMFKTGICHAALASHRVLGAIVQAAPSLPIHIRVWVRLCVSQAAAVAEDRSFHQALLFCHVSAIGC